MLTREDVMITIKTVRQGVSVSLFGQTEQERADFHEDDLPCEEEREDYDPEFDGPEEAEMMMEGRVIKTSQRLELSYRERE